MKRVQPSFDILRDLLPVLPDRFTIDEALSVWPEDQPRVYASVRYALNYLEREKWLVKDGRHGNCFYYRQVHNPQTVFHRTEQHKKWDECKREMGL